MFKFKAKIFVFVCLLFIFNQVMASQAGTLYDVDVLVENESANVRWGAFRQGLDEVFIRISGDSIIMDKLKRPAPTTYVKQYSYDPVENPTTNAKGKRQPYRIKIHYNGRAMEKYLRDNGFPVWGEHRPDIVVWLAVRDGRNEYVLKSTDQSLLKVATDEALKRRGIPGKWPLYDNKDKKVLKIADIRGGFKDPVMSASKRYSRGMALTGSLIWNGQQWQSSWSLLMVSGNRHWSLVDADYNNLISKSIDQAADAMGIIFATRGTSSKQQLTAIHLDVQSVNSVEKYRRVERYLSELNEIKMIKPLRVDGGKVLFEVLTRGDEKELLNVIKNDAKLAEIDALEIKAQQAKERKAKELEEREQEAKEQALKQLSVESQVAKLQDNSENMLAENEQEPGPEITTDKTQPSVKLTPVYHYRFIK